MDPGRSLEDLRVLGDLLKMIVSLSLLFVSHSLWCVLSMVVVCASGHYDNRLILSLFHVFMDIIIEYLICLAAWSRHCSCPRWPCIILVAFQTRQGCGKILQSPLSAPQNPCCLQVRILNCCGLLLFSDCIDVMLFL